MAIDVSLAIAPEQNAESERGEVRPQPPVVREGCGHCHQIQEDPYDPQTIYHQMTDDEPKYTSCQSAPGHPIHDCEKGDGGEWSYGPCEPPCPPDDGFATVLSRAHNLSDATATELQAEYPGLVSYSRISRTVVIRDCGGKIVHTAMVE